MPWAAERNEWGPNPGRGTRGADEGLNIEYAGLRHDDRREPWNLRTALRIAGNQWATVEGVRFGPATGQNKQKRVRTYSLVFRLPISGVRNLPCRCRKR